MIIEHGINKLPTAIMVFGLLIINRNKRLPSTIPHERIHIKQFKANPFLFYFRYAFSKKWRLKYEVEAYKESVKHGRSIHSCAVTMSGGLYRGMVSYDKALKLLTGDC